MSDSLQPHGLKPTSLLHLWDFPGNSTRVGCHFLLQGIFLIRDQTPIYRTAGRCFTVWATRKVHVSQEWDLTWFQCLCILWENGINILFPFSVKVKSESRSVVSDSLWPHGLWPARLPCSWDSPGQNTGVGVAVPFSRDWTQVSRIAGVCLSHRMSS